MIRHETINITYTQKAFQVVQWKANQPKIRILGLFIKNNQHVLAKTHANTRQENGGRSRGTNYCLFEVVGNRTVFSHDYCHY